MTKVEREVVVNNDQGLHARPAALFVQIAAKYDASVTVSKEGESVNGKSIMGILMLGAEKNSKVTISAEGTDAQQVVEELEGFLSNE